MTRILQLVLVFATLLLSSCNKDSDEINLEYKNLKAIEIGDYTLQVPSQFRIKEEQGIDSYIGNLVGSDLKIFFDFGVYTSPHENLSSNEYDVYNEIIGTVHQQVVIGKDPNTHYTSLHIYDSANSSPLGNYVSLAMSITNINKDEQDLVVQILESVELTQ